MGLKERIIKRLEKDVEITGGRVDLETLDEEIREKLFKQFGEGDENLIGFLKTAYTHGAPSQFCCSGHGSRPAYVNLKVTDENIELLRTLGKVLSNYNVVTNFTDDYIRGRFVDFRGINNNISTNWLSLASKILENPELYDSSNPSIYYHEEIHSSYKPFGFDLKKKLLHYLRGDKKQLAEKNETTLKENKEWWSLKEEDKERIKPIDSTSVGNNLQGEIVNELEEEQK